MAASPAEKKGKRMPKFESTKYPELWLSDLGMGFSGGTLETDDEDAIERLRKLGELGVRELDTAPQTQSQEPGGDPRGGEDEDPETQEGKPALTAEPPQRGASRAVWGEYAASQGLEGVEELTKAEIIERLGLA